MYKSCHFSICVGSENVKMLLLRQPADRIFAIAIVILDVHQIDSAWLRVLWMQIHHCPVRKTASRELH
jgi:hypothetical protein